MKKSDYVGPHVDFLIYGHFGFHVETQTKQKEENEMETGIIRW